MKLITVFMASLCVLTGCETMDAIDRALIEAKDGPAAPITEKATIALPFDEVVKKLTKLPVDKEVKEKKKTTKNEKDYYIIKPQGGWYPDPGAWDPGFIMSKEHYEKNFGHLGGKTGEYKSYSREFKYEDGYPATKCKTACKISILLKPGAEEGTTYSFVRYTGDGDLTVFKREMSRMIDNLLNGRPIDAKPKTSWTNFFKQD